MSFQWNGYRTGGEEASRKTRRKTADETEKAPKDFVASSSTTATTAAIDFLQNFIIIAAVRFPLANERNVVRNNGAKLGESLVAAAAVAFIPAAAASSLLTASKPCRFSGSRCCPKLFEMIEFARIGSIISLRWSRCWQTAKPSLKYHFKAFFKTTV